MSQEADLQTPKKKGERPGKVHLQNVVPLIDCWAVMDTPLDFSFMKLTTPAGPPSREGTLKTREWKTRDHEKYGGGNATGLDKKLSYRRGTARCVVSVEILPIATQQCRNYLYDKS